MKRAIYESEFVPSGSTMKFIISTKITIGSSCYSKILSNNEKIENDRMSRVGLVTRYATYQQANALYTY